MPVQPSGYACSPCRRHRRPRRARRACSPSTPPAPTKPAIPPPAPPWWSSTNRISSRSAARVSDLEGRAGRQPVTYRCRSPLGPNAYRGLGPHRHHHHHADRPRTLHDVPDRPPRTRSADTPTPRRPPTCHRGRPRDGRLPQPGLVTHRKTRPSIRLKVTNTGTAPLDLTTVRVRYHLRFEGGNSA